MAWYDIPAPPQRSPSEAVPLTPFQRLRRFDWGQPWLSQMTGARPSSADLQQPMPGDMPMLPMDASGAVDPRAAEAIARMQAAAQPRSQMSSPGAQDAYGPAFGGATSPVGGDPNSPTGNQRPMPPMRPGGAMPPVTPDLIQTGMAPIGGSAGPGSEPVFTPESPTQAAPTAAPPSEARGVVEEMMRNRGDKAPWLALAAAGFGTAAGTSPHAITNIGQGGLKGVEFYDRMVDRNARDRLAAANAMLNVEQQDRQAGFRQQEIGQGERRLGYEGQRVENERLNQKQQRENEAAKLQWEREKHIDEQPERQARGNYYNAMALAVPDKQTAKDQQAINMIVDNARQEAVAIATNKMTGEFDKAAFEAAKKASLLEQAQAMGIAPERLGVYPPVPRDPRQLQVGRVYENAKGVRARWTGTEWVAL